LHGKIDLVKPDGLQYDHLLEGVELVFPLFGHGLLLWLIRIEDSLELLVMSEEVLVKTLEAWEDLAHGNELLANISPCEIIKPVSGILLNLDVSLGTCEEEPQLIRVHLVSSIQNVDSHFE
jgi:hypothetical protein